MTQWHINITTTMHTKGNDTHLPYNSREQIFQGPACNHRVITKYEPRGEDAQITLEYPRSMWCQLLIGIGGVLVGMATYDKLRHHQRHTQQDYAQDINEDESSAAVFTNLCGKTPDVAQTYCRTCRSQNNA